MILLFCVLPNYRMHNCLQDIFLWYYALHVLDEVVSLSSLIVFQIVNHKVKSSLWDHIYQGWQHLQGILSTAEDYKVVTKQIIILENVASSR